MGESGKVRRWFPLEEEISATQWVGGIIVLSAEETVERGNGEKFQSFLERVVAQADTGMYAWHITGFDFAKEEFTSQGRCIRL